MALQTGEFPGWDRSPVAFIKKTRAVSQFATIATTDNIRSRLSCHDSVLRSAALLIGEIGLPKFYDHVTRFYLFIYNQSFIERHLQIDQRPFTCR